MTATTLEPESATPSSGDADSGRPAAPQPPPRPVNIPLQLIGTAFMLLAVVSLTFVVHLAVVSHLQYERTQQTAYADFRVQLARGEAPVGQSRVTYDLDGAAHERLVQPGEPVALLRIPVIGLDNVVVLEGTASGILQSGPGHRRDTVLPGQEGSSVIMGRRALYGGPFQDIDLLVPGDSIEATTGQGEHTYRVIGVTRAGDPVPHPSEDATGRLTLVTADGTPFVPTDAVRVHAELTSTTQPTPAREFDARDLPESEGALAVEPMAWMPLVLWGQALFLASLAVTWIRVQWGGWHAWLIGAPTLLALGLALADQGARLLPNLM